eukprot:TRINITY_DN102956_c0_g1_i1.p1 TRINITY_DN102956_c0_g1~~TRINITY_DN102956_c0_g1_i1.p1  ORF type:complete len:615 (+),score=82.21 TRINITY_DN102956_c0_g1_i1:61-1905(+)
MVRGSSPPPGAEMASPQVSRKGFGTMRPQEPDSHVFPKPQRRAGNGCLLYKVLPPWICSDRANASETPLQAGRGALEVKDVDNLRVPRIGPPRDYSSDVRPPSKEVSSARARATSPSESMRFPSKCSDVHESISKWTISKSRAAAALFPAEAPPRLFESQSQPSVSSTAAGVDVGSARRSESRESFGRHLSRPRLYSPAWVEKAETRGFTPCDADWSTPVPTAPPTCGADWSRPSIAAGTPQLEGPYKRPSSRLLDKYREDKAASAVIAPLAPAESRSSWLETPEPIEMGISSPAMPRLRSLRAARLNRAQSARTLPGVQSLASDGAESIESGAAKSSIRRSPSLRLSRSTSRSQLSARERRASSNRDRSGVTWSDTLRSSASLPLETPAQVETRETRRVRREASKSRASDASTHAPSEISKGATPRREDSINSGYSEYSIVSSARLASPTAVQAGGTPTTPQGGLGGIAESYDYSWRPLQSLLHSGWAESPHRVIPPAEVLDDDVRPKREQRQCSPPPNDYRVQEVMRRYQGKTGEEDATTAADSQSVFTVPDSGSAQQTIDTQLARLEEEHKELERLTRMIDAMKAEVRKEMVMAITNSNHNSVGSVEDVTP